MEKSASSSLEMWRRTMISAISGNVLLHALINFHSLAGWGGGGFITLCLLEPDNVSDALKLCKGQWHLDTGRYLKSQRFRCLLSFSRPVMTTGGLVMRTAASTAIKAVCCLPVTCAHVCVKTSSCCSYSLVSSDSLMHNAQNMRIRITDIWLLVIQDIAPLRGWPRTCMHMYNHKS